MVSDAELANRLREILRRADLETTTAAGIRRRLEEEFSVDLNDRKAFIREQIDLFLARIENAQNDDAQPSQQEEEDVEMEGENENGGSEVEEEEEEESDDEPRKKKSLCSRSNKRDRDAKKNGGGFTKLCALSPQLQELVGVSELARTEVVKKIWAYIREKNLQNPKNKKIILCDDALRGVFRVNSIDMFRMNKVLSKHIWPLEEEEDTPFKSSQKGRQRKLIRKEDEPKREGKPVKGKTSGFCAPCPISEALIKFLGTGEDELSRADAVKRIWQYVKENELQDPSDKRMILCDDKLRELFKVDSFHGFSVSKFLAAHFIKK